MDIWGVTASLQPDTSGFVVGADARCHWTTGETSQKNIMIETTKEEDRQCTSRGSHGACDGEAGLATPT